MHLGGGGGGGHSHPPPLVDLLYRFAPSLYLTCKLQFYTPLNKILNAALMTCVVDAVNCQSEPYVSTTQEEPPSIPSISLEEAEELRSAIVSLETQLSETLVQLAAKEDSEKKLSKSVNGFHLKWAGIVTMKRGLSHCMNWDMCGRLSMSFHCLC